MKKWIMLTVCLLITLVCCSALAESSGTCGDSVFWYLDDDGVLTIYGTGDMRRYDEEGVWLHPWEASLVKKVEVGEGVTGIGEHAFVDCVNLTSVSLPDSLTHIDDYAFLRCSGLKNIIIPAGVLVMGHANVPYDDGIYSCLNIFNGCSNLAKVQVATNNPVYSSYDGVVYSKDKTMLVHCPEGRSGVFTVPQFVTSFVLGGQNPYERSPFENCTKLTSVILPEGFEKIVGYVFRGCDHLASVYIPPSLDFIGYMAFRGCDSLADVYYAGNETQWRGIFITTYNEAVQNARLHLDCVYVNETRFPDVYFRSAISAYDLDENGVLTDSELANVTQMDVSDRYISSLEGISYFTSLTGLNCSGNRLATLDVSGNPLLTELNCSRNQLTALDLSLNTALLDLNCGNNGLAALDVRANRSLVSLNCESNLLNRLDLKRNTGLNRLITRYNEIATLNISTCPALTLLVSAAQKEYSSGTWTWNMNPQAGGKYPYQYTLTIDQDVVLVSDQPDPETEPAINATYFPDPVFQEFVRAYDQNQDGELSETELARVTVMYVNNRGISDLTGIEFFTELTILHCYDNKISSLNLSALTKLVELDCGDNPISTLDLSRNTALATLICGNTYLTTLDLSMNRSLTRLVCEQYCYGWNELVSIDVRPCAVLNALVKQASYSDHTIPGHPYLYNHLLHGWWLANADDTLAYFLFVGPDVEVTTDDGIYVGGKKKPDPDPEPDPDPQPDENKIAAFVSRCYSIILGRDPDAGGLQTWVNELSSGRKAASEIIDRFVNSTEFTGKNYSNEQSVEILYMAMLGRGSDPAGRANWVAKLEAGQPFAVIINGFCRSAEFTGICDTYGIEPGSVTIPDDPKTPDEKIIAFIRRCYKIILNRDPDPSGLQTWFTQLKNRWKAAAEIIDRFVNSPEFTGKHYSYGDAVEILYKTMLNRGSDPAGKANWVAKLEAGQTLAHVINGFCRSPEFVGICESYGINPGSVVIPFNGAEEPISRTVVEKEENGETASAAREIILADERIEDELDTAVMVVYYNAEKAAEFVRRCYSVILGRSETDEAIGKWVEQILNGAKTPDQIIRGFLFSGEFGNREKSNEELVKILYKVYMNRDADPEGLATWTAKLDGGMTMKELADALAKTDEYRKMVQGLEQ